MDLHPLRENLLDGLGKVLNHHGFQTERIDSKRLGLL